MAGSTGKKGEERKKSVKCICEKRERERRKSEEEEKENEEKVGI